MAKFFFGSRFRWSVLDRLAFGPVNLSDQIDPVRRFCIKIRNYSVIGGFKSSAAFGNGVWGQVWAMALGGGI